MLVQCICRLDRTFNQVNIVTLNRGSQEYKDFWLFLERYESFHQRHAEKHSRSGKSTRQRSFFITFIVNGRCTIVLFRHFDLSQSHYLYTVFEVIVFLSDRTNQRQGIS